jgi:hypothetical protein
MLEKPTLVKVATVCNLDKESLGIGSPGLIFCKSSRLVARKCG